MKKLTILTSLAVMSISGSAMAVRVAPAEPPRAIFIEEMAAGTGQFFFRFAGPSLGVAAPNGTCVYDLNWTFNPLMGPLTCRVAEARTLTNQACMGPGSNMTMDINSTMYAGDNFTPFCNGFNQFGLPFFGGILVLGESRTASPSINGIFLDPNFGFVTQGITIA